MRASRCRTWARTAPSLILIPVLSLALLTVFVLTVGRAAGADATGKATAADSSAGDGGFRVRVIEESSPGSKSKQSAERARRDARRMKEEARAGEKELEADFPTPPDLPEPPEISTSIEFDSNDNNVVRFGADITIPEGQVIDGDVVAIGGSVTVLGRVKGDCVSIGGAVHIEGKGVVEGDAVAMGGGVSTSDSGSVGGSNVSLGTNPFGHSGQFWPMVGLFGAVGAVGTGFWLLTALLKLALTLFFAWLSLLLARERIVHAVDTMHVHFGRSFLWGLLGFAGAVVALPTGIILLILVGTIAIAILAITIIGIPVAILLLIALILGIMGLVLALFIAMFLGFLIGAMFLGQRVLGRNSPRGQKPLVAILVGLVLLVVLEIAAKLIGLVGVLFFHPIAIALGIAAGGLAVILSVAGFGAMITTRFAARSGGAGGTQWWPPFGPSHTPAIQGPAVTPPGGVGAQPLSTPPPGGGSSDAP